MSVYQGRVLMGKENSLLQIQNQSPTQLQFYKSFNYLRMNFDDFPIQQIDEKYELLLSEYTRLKKELNLPANDFQYSSGKSLGQQKSPSQNNFEEEIAKIKEEIQKQKTKASSVKNRFESENNALEERIRAQRAGLEDQSQINGQNAKRGSLLSEKQQIETEIQQLESLINQDLQNLRNLQGQKNLVEQKTKTLISQKENNNQLEGQANNQIEILKKQAQETDNALKNLKAQLEKLSSGSSNEKDINPAALSEELAKIEQQIKKQKVENEKGSKQFENQKDSLKNAEKKAKEATEKQAGLIKELDNSKLTQVKLRKLIEDHANEIKKKTEQKKDKKARQADANAELLRVENQNKFLQNSIKWEAKKLTDFLEIKKTYLDKSEVEGLNEKKKQYEKFNKSCEADVIKLKNLTRKHEEIQLTVSKLKKQNAKIINEKEYQIKQMKDRSSELRKKKEETEKKLTESKSKLDEYKKEYPNHELEKARIVEEQKKRKAEESKRKQEQINALKSQTKKKTKIDASTEEQDLEKYLPRAPSEEKSIQTILSNPTYQYAGIAALVLIILLAYYAL